MLPKFEFGHFYKFAVSVGLILLAFGLILPWLVVRDTSALRITESQLRDITPTARAVIQKKQSHQRWIVDHYPSVAAVSSLMGVVILGYGSSKWLQRQSVLDETEDVQRDTAKAQLVQMTPTQIEEKREAEVVGAVTDGSTDLIVLADTPVPSGPPAEQPQYVQVRRAVARVEQELTDLLKQVFDGTHRLEAHMTVGMDRGRFLVDLVAHALRKGHPSYIVEYKYSTGAKNLSNRLIEGATQVLLASSEASASLGSPYTGVLLLVYGGEVEEISAGRLAALRARLSQFRLMARPSLKALLIAEADLTSVSSDDVRRGIGALEPRSFGKVHAL